LFLAADHVQSVHDARRALIAPRTLLDLFDQIPEGETEVQDLYRNLLQKHRCLIVFDDAKDANQLRPLLPPAPVQR
jgi:hypothetical protein